jgi:hypothetical protein
MFRFWFANGQGFRLTAFEAERSNSEALQSAMKTWAVSRQSIVES